MSDILLKYLANLRNNKTMAIIVLMIGVPINLFFYSSWTKNASIDASENINQQTLNKRSVNDVDTLNIGEGKKESALEHASKHADPKFICPMHSEIILEDPDATCPICGMDLVVLEINGDAIVEVSPTMLNALGVRTKKAKKGTIYRKINSVGYVTYDEKKIRRITLRTAGWIEELVVKSLGDKVRKDDLLFRVYSPMLVNAQEEYLQTFGLVNNKESFKAASRKRLLALGISSKQINHLEEHQEVEQLVSIYAPQDGVIIDLNIQEGAFVPPSTSVVSLVDLSSVWLLADIFESQIRWIKAGQNADATLSFIPDKVLRGVVDYVYPSVNVKTRSVKARLKFSNIDELLKPNMYANITIYAKPRRKILTVPREAVIRTGSQSRVIVALGSGRFKQAIVQTGVVSSHKIEIKSGIEEGDEVVVSSQFLLDSESSMRAAVQRLAGD